MEVMEASMAQAKANFVFRPFGAAVTVSSATSETILPSGALCSLPISSLQQEEEILSALQNVKFSADFEYKALVSLAVVMGCEAYLGFTRGLYRKWLDPITALPLGELLA